MELGVLIVTYNSGACVLECLQSCRTFGLFDSADVLVVDNDSADDSVQNARQGGARVIANAANRGFAAAVNQGVRELGTPLVLLLNPDVTLASSVEPLVTDLHASGAAAAGGKLLNPDGSVQRGFQVRRFPTTLSLAFEALGINRLFPGNPVNQRYRCLDLDPDVAADVEQPAGAFLLFRTAAWESAGGLDENFFPLWFEDVDFLKRLADEGHRIRYVPQATAWHAGAHSLIRLKTDYRQLYWYGSLLTYLARHFSAIGRVLVASAVVLGMVLRSVMGTFRQMSIRPLGICAKVAWMAGNCVFNPKAFEEKRVLRAASPQAR